MSLRHRFATVIGLLVLALVAGCKGSVTPIEKLLEDPSRYDGQTVRIAGSVESSIGVLGYGAYRVDDGTGKLMVLTSEGGAPREGAKVGVEGQFRSGFTVGTTTGSALMERKRFTP